jgi:elongator complex protein 3
LDRRGQRCRCVRCREIRQQAVALDKLRLDDLVYHPAWAEEHCLTFVTPDDHIAGYLRLSLPDPAHPLLKNQAPVKPGLEFSDLDGAALVREVHVFGQALAVGAEQAGAAQHAGLGTALLHEAEQIARRAGFRRLAVIAAVGTRRYYEGRGFHTGQLYMLKDL